MTKHTYVAWIQKKTNHHPHPLLQYYPDACCGGGDDWDGLGWYQICPPTLTIRYSCNWNGLTHPSTRCQQWWWGWLGWTALEGFPSSSPASSLGGSGCWLWWCIRWCWCWCCYTWCWCCNTWCWCYNTWCWCCNTWCWCCNTWCWCCNTWCWCWTKHLWKGFPPRHLPAHWWDKVHKVDIRFISDADADC